jgi:fibronectin type 3 domain-containing protein
MNRELLTRLFSYYGIVLFICLVFLPGCDSGLSNEGGTSSGTAPSSPTGVSVSSGSAKGTIMVHWDALREAGSYIIYSSTTPGIENNKFRNKRRVTKPNFTISGLTSGKTYYFSVTALNGSGESGMSAEVSATAP